MTINLLKETIEFLEDNGKTTDDVLWVGSGDSVCVWEVFAEIAKDIDYNDGYGAEEISTRLKVVGNNWWLERANYDGSEWWEFKRMPKLPKNKALLTRESIKIEW